jgi:hypothetical protein
LLPTLPPTLIIFARISEKLTRNPKNSGGGNCGRVEAKKQTSNISALLYGKLCYLRPPFHPAFHPPNTLYILFIFS